MPTYQTVSPAMRRILENLVAGRPTLGHLRGQSAHGGAFGTVQALHRRGWIGLNEATQWVITPAGRTAIGADAPERDTRTIDMFEGAPL